jgi:hypothetical protein
MVCIKSKCQSVTAQFELGLVWDDKVYWYLKEKDAAYFGHVGTADGRMQSAYTGPVKRECIDKEDWETEPILRSRSPWARAKGDRKLRVRKSAPPARRNPRNDRLGKRKAHLLSVKQP